MVKGIGEVREILESERKRLREELIMRTNNHGGDASDVSLFSEKGEMAARASDLERQAILLRRTRNQLAEVERALGKLETGTYGLCDRCGNAIPAARLEILPQTNLCLRCKSGK